ncbi:2-succinyl-6-hydroxy-2,4-cyclohexadiene-1-carboxylate synthase [uncultured archaeon]|nr:2-succinyl-6-hydroxy-2,4-cyclohexadiene-1-carboxylate synthase [uncultured archaeon]
MPENLSIFKTPESQARYMAAYDAVLALWPVPYESFDIPTRFGKTHIIASGPKGAPPLVLLHATSASSTMWFPNIADLSREYRVYALDVIGDAGKSVVSYPPQNKSDYALWLTDVFNELNITQADVVGASYGGWVTLNLALYSQERVKKIVLISPPAAFAPFNKMYISRIVPSMLLPIRPFIINSIRPLFVKRPNETYLEQLVLAATCKFKLVFPTEFTDDELQQIKTPALLLIGEKEVIFSAQKAIDRATRLMPNIQAEIIPDAGHIPSMDRHEMVNERILKFLNKNFHASELQK